MSGQNWRTEVNAEDHFGHQKKRVELEQRRPVIRRASDLVGPGIGIEATRITDYNNILATFNGYYSSLPGALNAPPGDESFVGTTVSDSALGGTQTFVGLSSTYEYTRTFVRNASDATSISWGVWEGTERVPASATSKEARDTAISNQGAHLLRPPRIDTIGAPGSYDRGRRDIYVLRPGVYAGSLFVEAPDTVAFTITVTHPDRIGFKTIVVGPIKGKLLAPIPFTFWSTGENQEIRVHASHLNAVVQTVVWKEFTIVRIGDVPTDGFLETGEPTRDSADGWSPTPVDPGGSPEDDEIQWEDGDFVTLTQGNISAGTVTLNLSHIPEPESLLAWWHPGGMA